MTNVTERRRTRINTIKEATLSGESGAIRAVVENVSLKGCMLQVGVDTGFEEGTHAGLVIHLDRDAPEFDIRVRGVIVRREESVIALDFDEVSPESFPHLLRFVQYNSEDPERIESELAKSAYDAEG